MVVIDLIRKLLALYDGLLGQFVTGNIATNYAITTKGNYVVGAVADMVTYGSIMWDWLVQTLLGPPTNAV